MIPSSCPCPRLRAEARRLTSLEPSALLHLFPDVFSSHDLGLINIRLRIYTPLVTVALAVWQHLWGASACSEAVLHLIAMRASQGLSAISASTGAFCRAKKRLPPAMIDSLADGLAAATVKGVTQGMLWFGHRVKLLDGTTFSLPDTEANQAVWPQPPTQKPTQGFPQLRLVALFCLATGVILERVVGTYRQGEPTLFRKLLDALKPGDIVVRDRAFAGYPLIAQLYERNVHTVTRLLTQVTNFSRIRRLGPGDTLVRLGRSQRCPGSLTPEEYRNLPQSLIVRIVDVRIDIPGFRTQSYRLLTTLIDPKRYPADALAELYRNRWEVEVDIRHIKITMGAEMLRSHTPEMARREMAFMALAYNIIRATMVLAGKKAAIDPRRLSFSMAMAAIRQLNAVLCGVGRISARKIIATILQALGKSPVPNRPGRSEPRAVKRRYRDYPRLRGARRQIKDRPHLSRQYARAKRAREKVQGILPA